MNANTLGFDLFALAQPKSRADLEALARELIFEIENFNALWDAMISKIERAELVETA